MKPQQPFNSFKSSAGLFQGWKVSSFFRSFIQIPNCRPTRLWTGFLFSFRNPNECFCFQLFHLPATVSSFSQSCVRTCALVYFFWIIFRFALIPLRNIWQHIVCKTFSPVPSSKISSSWSSLVRWLALSLLSKARTRPCQFCCYDFFRLHFFRLIICFVFFYFFVFFHLLCLSKLISYAHTQIRFQLNPPMPSSTLITPLTPSTLSFNFLNSISIHSTGILFTKVLIRVFDVFSVYRRF